MTTPENTEQTVDTDIEGIIETIAKEKPWRGPIYGFVYFLRRWMVFMFAMHFCIFTGQPWFITVPLGILTFLSDRFIAPRYATDLRLSDQEFVRKVCIDHFIEGPFASDVLETIKKIAIIPILIGLIYILSCFIYFAFEMKFLKINLEGYKNIYVYINISYIIGLIQLLILTAILALRSYTYPHFQFPNINAINKNKNFITGINTRRREQIDLFYYRLHVMNLAQNRIFIVFSDILLFITTTIMYLKLYEDFYIEKYIIAYALSASLGVFVFSWLCVYRVYWKFDDIACLYANLTKKKARRSE